MFSPLTHPRPAATIEISTAADVLIAQRRARVLAEQLGFARRAQWEFATAVSEAATNILCHASGGAIEFDADDERVEFTAIDTGAGIADLDRALVDGVSLGSALERGSLGCGMGAIARLMDGVTVETSACRGTIVRAYKRRHATARTFRSSCPR